MLTHYTIASKPNVIRDFYKLSLIDHIDPVYKSSSKQSLPIIIRENDKNKLVMASWGLQFGRKPLETTVPLKGILSNQPYNLMLRQTRCVIPCNCFFGMKGGDPYLIRLTNQRLFSVGGIYDVRHKGSEPEYRFAMLTVEPADLVQSFLEEMPLILGYDRYNGWLSDSDMQHLMFLADRAGGYWFDYFKIGNGFLTARENDPAILKPVGGSYMQQERRKELERIAYLEKNRKDRGSGK